MKLYKYIPEICKLPNEKNYSLIGVQPKDCIDEEFPCWSKLVIFSKPKGMSQEDYEDVICSIKINEERLRR
jgi:hypothetical protein